MTKSYSQIDDIAQMVRAICDPGDIQMLITALMCKDDYGADEAFKVLNDSILAEDFLPLAEKLTNAMKPKETK